MPKAGLDTMGPDELNRPKERKRAVFDVFASADPRFDGRVFVGVPPTGFRRHGKAADIPSGTATIRLGYRPPYRFPELLSFFRARMLLGVEAVDDNSYARTVLLNEPNGKTVQGWLRVQDDPKRNGLMVTMSESLVPCVPQVIARVRRLFDCDCDPQTIAGRLASLDNIVPGAVREGTRLPGCFEPFETACRAVLGQQISVSAANKLAARIVEHFGTPVETAIDGLTHAFPTPADVLALDPIESAFGELGVIRARSKAIAQIARMLDSNQLDLSMGAVPEEQIGTLLSIKGIGPWTANYIAMRVLSHPDVFLEKDAGVAHALPDMTPKQRLVKAEAWRPWRSYAVISLWHSLVD